MLTVMQEAYKLALSEKAQIKVIEMKSGNGDKYKIFFNSVLKKFAVSSLNDLSAEKKKEFLDYVDANWDAKNETD